jgi:hypothetical protein
MKEITPEKFDTRYRAIEKKDEKLLILMRNEKIGKKKKVNVDFGLPSAPALFLNLARILTKKSN